MNQRDRRPAFALGTWIVEPDFNQVSQGDISHRVEPKVMSVLLELASQAQRVVSKEEILRAVWPDTFVGEDALTRCISVLRRVFEDDPHHPHFIKTVSKVGYCLLVAAEPLEAAHPGPPPESPQPELPEHAEHAEVLMTAAATAPTTHTAAPVEHPVGRQNSRSIPIAVAASLLLATGIALWTTHSIRTKAASPPIRVFQSTTNAGEQSRPALSPDGKRLAFVWLKEDGGQQHIYIKELGKESLLPLTTLADNEFSPAWSPDGKEIAFLSSSPAGLGLYVASSTGSSPPRKVYIPGETTGWEQGALSWSPDGKNFVLVDHVGSEPSSSIYLIDAETLRARPLTAPPSGWEGDLNPVFSPDGRKIAFLRASESSVEDIYWIPTSGGEPRQITHDGKMINGIAWSSDNRAILFSSNRAGQYALWKVLLQEGLPSRMPVGTEDATQPAVPQNGRNLAFVQGSAIFGILRISLKKEDVHETTESLIVSSTAQDSAPAISPDGKEFAFQSWRSGNQQIWISSIDGQSLRQLSPSGGLLLGSGSPSWSPSGDQIAFDSRISGHSHIFVIPAAGGSPKQITFGELNDIVPRWSLDGNSIYFRSNRGGRWQLWKLQVAGGMTQPVTSDDGLVGQESPDGKWLYFARGGENGIWRMPAAGGEAVRILDQPNASYWAYWTVGSNGIYFLDQKQSSPSISLYDPASKQVTSVAKLNRLPPLYSGLSLLPDGRSLLISDKRNAGSHISIAQGVF